MFRTATSDCCLLMYWLRFGFVWTAAGSGPSPPSSNGACDDMIAPLSKRQQQSRGPTASPESQAPKSKGRINTSNSHLEIRNGDGRPILSNARKAFDMPNGTDKSANGISRGNSGPGRPVDKSGPPKANGNGIVRKFETRPPVPKDNKPKPEQKVKIVSTYFLMF